MKRELGCYSVQSIFPRPFSIHSAHILTASIIVASEIVHLDNMSLDPRFQLLPASLPADVDGMVEVNYLAYAESNPMMLTYFPAIPGVDRRAELIRWFKTSMEGSTRKGDGHRTIYMKVVDTGKCDGEKSTIAAYSAWQIPDLRLLTVSAEEDDRKEAAAAEANAEDPFFPTGADRAALNLRRSNMKAKRKEAFGENWEAKNWYLSSLATHPAYQGQGFGTSLVRWGLEQAQADAQTRPHEIEGACTVSTPAGLATYKKCGMVEVTEHVHEMGHGTGAQRYKSVFLVKKLGPTAL